MTDENPVPEMQRIAARTVDVGGMPVRRVLPTRERRTVGAWCFLDHAGPVEFDAGGGIHVGPHPHIGLQTFTWMIEGEVLHSDSLGNQQWIRPGQVNVMTAGHGISHAEEAPEDRAGRSHAVQLWIALPDAERERAPMFQHCPELPRIERGGFDITLLVGDWLGATSPAQVFSPLLGADLRAQAAAATTLPLRTDFEHAVVCLDGEIRVEGEPLASGTLLYLEGYLFDPPAAKEAFWQAAGDAHRSSTVVSLTLSDPFCVDRHRADFREFLAGAVDVVFANESELCSLYEVNSLDEAIDAVRRDCSLAAITRGSDGSVIVTPNDTVTVGIEPVSLVADTTGAGDLYASGFLFGLARELPLAVCGELGAKAAAEAISHLGARPQTDLSAWVQRAASSR